MKEISKGAKVAKAEKVLVKLGDAAPAFRPAR